MAIPSLVRETIESDRTGPQALAKVPGQMEESKNAGARLVGLLCTVLNEGRARFPINICAHIRPTLMADAVLDELSIECFPILAITREFPNFTGDEIRRSSEEDRAGRLECIGVQRVRIKGELSGGFPRIGKNEIVRLVSRGTKVPATVESYDDIMRINLEGLRAIDRTIADDRDSCGLAKPRQVFGEPTFGKPRRIFYRQCS